MPIPLFILQVEDDHDDVELLQDAFKENGVLFTVEVIKQGDKVLPWFEQATRLPDVVVMDLNLPKMHGKEILGKLKDNEKLKSIPVVILTTSSSKAEMTFCLENGADEFITKPSSVEGFRQAVNIILSVAAKPGC